jgi:HAMP domain-containing protein
MKHIHKIVVGLFVALAVAIPLVFAATATQSTEQPTSVIRIAVDPTDTPRPPGQPCHGGDC